MSDEQFNQLITLLSYQLQAMNQMCAKLDGILDAVENLNEDLAHASFEPDEPDMFATLNGPRTTP